MCKSSDHYVKTSILSTCNRLILQVTCVVATPWF
uniref:Uncharacterized protein n=1 Tax=Anguilla anguilla TaxID=7936 RepID=A0A0E9XMA7_ANGAN